MKKSSRLLVLDANALIHRAFHALPPLTSPTGDPVGALYGLCLTLLNVLKTFHPTHVVAAFDRPEKTFRHEQFAAYKAQRTKAPEELRAQIIRAREILEAFAIPVLDAKRYEADDVIGTVTHHAAREGVESVIVTGDQDTLQLVTPNTRVHLLRRGVKDTVTVGPAEVRERFGLTPEQLVDYKALRGDPSDNIPGVRGVGEKTATALLQQYGSLEEIYRHLKKIDPATRKKLEAGKIDAFLSRKLVTITRDVPLEGDFDAFARKPYDRARAITLFQKLGFASLLPKLPEPSVGVSAHDHVQTQRLDLRASSPAAPAPKPRTKGYHLVASAAETKELAKKLAQSDGFVVDTETERLGARTQPLHGVSVAMTEGEAWYVPAAHVPLLRPVLEHPRIPKYGHNLKYDVEVLQRAGIALRPLAFDTMLASYVLAPGTRAHDLDTLAFTILGHEKIRLESLIGKGKDQKALSEVPLEEVAEYSCEDADMTLRLVRHFEREFKKEPRLRHVLHEIEVPLIPALAHVELAGVKLDVSFLQQLRRRVDRQRATLERRIHQLAGRTFNIASPSQLRDVLFTNLKLSVVGIGRTQTGLSTAAEELGKLKDAHPVIPLILEHREVSKLMSTYLDALPGLVDRETGRVYTTYNQTGTVTGRLSSVDPNLQNIPIRTQLGAEIRKAFVAERGHVLLSADYSQLQLRLAAHIAGDRAMQAAFRAGKDIHAETAAFAFDVPLEKVTPAQRRVAKTLNFGVLYGMGPQAFARAAGISLAEAQRFIDEYMRTYRGIAQYMEEAKAAAATQGYVETLAGRRRYLPEMSSRNPQIRGEAERMAINHPIQGSEADVMKKAMIRIYAELEHGRGPFRDVRLILQVHDELVFEVPSTAAPAIGRAVRAIMESVETLSVPLVAEVYTGRNWGAMRELRV
ncbi:MAG: DNA polymerase I [Parcubacteria group bacterium Gr01-1014_38]|nr:MAG: DNA polymerase I [Parcubacteria group bacterium Gr01-1014_38]